MDVTRAIPMAAAADFVRWLDEHGQFESEVILAIFRKDTGKQTVSFDDLLETALCYGWVDTQTKGIDEQRYAIRFTPRRPGSNWSQRNRDIARRLIEEEKMTSAGLAALPPDL